VCAYEPCRRVAGDLLLQALKDADPEVRLPAARALVQSGSIDELGHVFRLAVSQSLLIRILLAEDLRRHATELCAQAIPQVLAGDNPKQTVAALQILIAWERALPLPDLHKLLESDNREVRLEALRLAKLVPLSAENRSALLRFLREGDEEENTLAALTAGRLRLQEALPSLARCLRTGTSELAGIAASALAEMPPKGWQTLQQIAGGTDSAALIAAAAQSICLAGFLNFTQSNTFLMGVLAALELGACLAGPIVAMVLVMGRRRAALLGIYLGWLLVSQAMAGGLLASWK